MPVTIIQSKEKKTVKYDKLEYGKIYQCVNSNSEYYIGYLLYAVMINSEKCKYFGHWIGNGPSLFNSYTSDYSSFEFVEVDATITIKE